MTCAALHAEHGAHGGLPQGHHGVLAQLPQTVGQAHGGGGLALAGGGGVDGGHQHQLAVGLLDLPQQGIVHLRLHIAVQLQIFFIHAGGPGDLRDGLRGAGLGDLNVRQNLHIQPPKNINQQPKKVLLIRA